MTSSLRRRLHWGHWPGGALRNGHGRGPCVKSAPSSVARAPADGSRRCTGSDIGGRSLRCRRARASRRRSATACFCSSCCTLAARHLLHAGGGVGFDPRSTRRMAAVDVLDLVERTASSLTGLYEPDLWPGQGPGPRVCGCGDDLACTALGALYGLAPLSLGRRRLPAHPRASPTALFFTGLSLAIASCPVPLALRSNVPARRYLRIKSPPDAAVP